MGLLIDLSLDFIKEITSTIKNLNLAFTNS